MGLVGMLKATEDGSTGQGSAATAPIAKPLIGELTVVRWSTTQHDITACVVVAKVKWLHFQPPVGGHFHH